MKKIIKPLVVAMALVLVPLALGAVNYVSHSISYDNNLIFDTDTLGGVTYTTVSYGDLENDGEPGKPSLPIDYIRFSVPYNATNFTVSALTSLWVNSYVGHQLYPTQLPLIPDAIGIPRPITLPDSSAYSGNYYPSKMAWVVDEGFLAGENHIVTVAVMPVRYKHTPTSDLVGKSRKVTVRLNYELSDSLAVYPIVRNDSALRVEGYELTQKMVVNPNQVSSFSYSYNLPGPVGPSGPINPNGGLGGDGLNGGYQPEDPGGNVGYGGELQEADKQHFTYLIVTTDDFYQPMRRLAALKRQKGYSVRIVKMNNAINDSCAINGDQIKKSDGTYHVAYNDNAGKLRQFIRKCYENHGTKYVLLAGTSIPYRHINGVEDDGITIKNIDCISDFYYSELNSDWSEDTIVDHAPDLFVGRILAKELAQVENYTTKLFRYELNPGRGDHSYLRRLLLEQGSCFPGGLNQFKNSIFMVFPANCAKEFKESVSTFRPTGKEVIDTLNTFPVGLINILNHGDTTKVYVYADELNRFHYINSISSETDGNGLNCLNNRDYPMIFYSPACQTVPYDNTIGINMGESFTTGKDYGGPVYIGNTRTIVFETTRYVMSCFANRLKNGYYTLGMADELSVWDHKDAFRRYQDPSLIHAYIGDPSVEIWTDIPHRFNNVQITRTDNSLTITGIDKDSTIVAYSYYDSILRKTVNSSNITINDSPNASVMIYGHNSIPYIVPMVLQNVNLCGSQYIIASDFIAGKSIDSGRSIGDVIVKEGARYEIEAAGTTTLCGGFQVEPGASFSVIPSAFGDNRF